MGYEPQQAPAAGSYVRALPSDRIGRSHRTGSLRCAGEKGFLATEHPSTHRQVVTASAWPVMVLDATDNLVPSAKFMVSYAQREEKGSDVNVASHLLRDVL